MKLELTGSKSIINRILCLALYHNADVILNNVNFCTDVGEMLHLYDAVKFDYRIIQDQIFIYHTNFDYSQKIQIRINESGTCLRFALSFFAFNSFPEVTILLGSRLAERPIIPLIKCLNRTGANITMHNGVIRIEKTKTIGKNFFLDEIDSSQYVSSLMMLISVPMTRMPINCNLKNISSSYIKMTEDILTKFNTKIFSLNNTITIQKKLIIPLHISFETDYSTACYIFLYSMIMEKPIYIKKIHDFSQPDYKFLEVLKKINFYIFEDDDYVSIDINMISPLENLLIDMKDMPDQIITLAFLAFCLHFTVNITGCESLSLKESDRVKGIIKNIKLLGGHADYSNGILSITPSYEDPLECELLTFRDHRFAMTFWVMKQKFSYLAIDYLGCIDKSYLGFRKLIDKLK